MSHLEERLKKDLDKVHDRVAKMGAQVQDAVKNAVQALLTGNHDLAYMTVLKDNPINRCMREIDRVCHSFIAVHIPTGGHLRLLSSVIRVNIELERIGDYAVTIAREAAQLSEPPSGALLEELVRISDETSLMLSKSISAFGNLDADMAKRTMAMADELEHNLDSVYTGMMANDDRERVKDILAVFVVFTQLKRISDQAKNLCEDTIFAVTGEQKKPKIFKILFIDEDNGCFSQMAEAIARQSYPGFGEYRSAGRNPVNSLDPKMISFLDNKGINHAQAQATAVSQLSEHEIFEQHVVVSLQGNFSSYLSTIPFHTSAMDWDIASSENPQGEQDYTKLYDEISLKVKALMELLRGEGAS
ncbi:MAG: phosphate signaling complex protein PhoU [Candidatus Thiodiazotropha sp. (ex Monitilora ramsayi)]|nr:phosphate signaling complex protein PhoU [Candidatus Thiodiazotropha sp. (ex Monitilora ramsayi)]